MITEDYVSYETAKLLKKKGFDVPCEQAYHNGLLVDYTMYGFCNGEILDCPTLQMAMKWLREVHSLEIYPYHDFIGDNDSWWFEIIRFNSSYAEHESDSIYHTYEQACEAAIKYCLENLIQIC